MSSDCNKINKLLFSNTLSKELNLNISIDTILNESQCVFFYLDLTKEMGDSILDEKDILEPFKNRMGLYHLWIDEKECDKDEYMMLCVYVGKGWAYDRIRNHLKNKWDNISDVKLYVTFYECENRIAKYLEQLFLDIYDFHFNKEENKGTEYLRTCWDDYRHDVGTEVYEQGERLLEKNPDLLKILRD